MTLSFGAWVNVHGMSPSPGAWDQYHHNYLNLAAPEYTTSNILENISQYSNTTGQPTVASQGQGTQPPTPSTEPVTIGTMTGTMTYHDWAFKSSKSVKKEPENKIYNRPIIEAFTRLREYRTDGEIGLEIECEGTNLFQSPIKFWTCHQDNSLRPDGEHPPVEYVLRKPISRKEVSEALTYLNGKLRQTGSNINNSPRTSVHVHLNCQKLTIKEIYQIWCLYTVFEEILVDFSGSERVGNLFCLRTKDAEYHISVMESAIQNENFTELFDNNLRYTSCNTASIGKFGSLEFRSMRGTVDQDLIETWIDILLTLRDEALKYDSPREIVEEFMRLKPEAFCRKVFKFRPEILPMFFNRTDLSSTLWDGLRLMRDVACAVRWEKRDPSLDKKKDHQESDQLSSFDNSIDYSSWISHHPGLVPVHRVRDNLWVMKESGGTRKWVINYSGHSMSATVVNNPPYVYSPRSWYLLNGDGLLALSSGYLSSNNQTQPTPPHENLFEELPYNEDEEEYEAESEF